MSSPQGDSGRPSPPVRALQWTGERMVPEGADTITFWEHVYRYRFAAPLARGKRVLDIACGEGYGAAALRHAGAAGVIGVDVSEEACEHARLKYGLDVRTGSAEHIPLDDSSVDLVVSFETIEHVDAPDRFIRECVRVLSPRGMIVISTPSKEVYAAHGRSSDFHQSEMSRQEFTSLLNQHFPGCALYGQMFASDSWRYPSPLTALSSPWFRLPSALRIRNLIRRAACPHITGEVDEAYRNSVVEVILGGDGRACRLVNPYTVRRLPRSLPVAPVYLIAVASL